MKITIKILTLLVNLAIKYQKQIKTTIKSNKIVKICMVLLILTLVILFIFEGTQTDMSDYIEMFDSINI